MVASGWAGWYGVARTHTLTHACPPANTAFFIDVKVFLFYVEHFPLRKNKFFSLAFADKVLQACPMLKFTNGNAKLEKGIWSFSVPSGHTCPFAKDCLSKADRSTGKITDGKATVFRCFSASQEAVFPNVRNSRWHNFDVLKGLKFGEMASLIQKSLPPSAKKIRIHVGGDFFSQSYFDAWLCVAKVNPDIVFYSYTKSLKFWIKRLEEIPSNFILTASKGTKNDSLIEEYNLRYSEVVYSIEEAEEKGLEIDHDDSHAYTGGPSFALLIHGTQPAKSESGKKKNALKGVGSYSRRKGGK